MAGSSPAMTIRAICVLLAKNGAGTLDEPALTAYLLGRAFARSLALYAA